MKKFFYVSFVIFSFLILSISVSASSIGEARIGNNFYDTLEDAIEASTSTDTISLTSNVTLDKTLEIHKTVNINLNNYNIEAENKVFLVQGGSLNLSGKGKIIETKPYYGVITLLGSDNASDKDYSTTSVGSEVTLEGWSGIFIEHNKSTAYGILVNMNGSINALDDVDGGSGAGIYVNGNIKHEDNSPIINLSDTTHITSTGNGIYAAGYATYNINGAYIEGKESGLGIKSGVFNILDGTIVGSGDDKTPTTGNNNGINASGSAIQIESNASYKGNIELTIKNGTINSKNSNVIYEYTVNNTDTKVKDISISGGTFTSDIGKDVFELSNSLKETHPHFITGGEYSSDVSTFVASSHEIVKNGSLYEVASSTMGVFAAKNDNNNVPLLSIIIPLIIVFIIIYLNRKKIFTLINSIKH